MARNKGGDGGKKTSRFKQLAAKYRAKWPIVDRGMRMQDHYFYVSGSLLAGAATYYGFLAFFPILAVGFAVVGFISDAYPQAQDNLTTAIEQLFPGIVSASGDAGTVSLLQIQTAKVTAGVLGFLGVLYSGLGWLSGLRYALLLVFEVPVPRRRHFVAGKLVDLVTLVILGIILILSVSVSGLIAGAADWLLNTMNLDDTWVAKSVLWAVGALVGWAISALLFFVIFRALGEPDIPTLSVWEGALVGALGFEFLKAGAVIVIKFFGGSAFAPLVIAVTLMVWINYFSRLVIYGASFAFVAARNPERGAAAALPLALQRHPFEVTEVEAEPLPEVATTFDAGSAMLGALAGFVAATLLGRRAKP